MPASTSKAESQHNQETESCIDIEVTTYTADVLGKK